METMGFEKDFKNLVAKAIETKFKSQLDLAKKAGLAQSAISTLLSGKRQSLMLESVARIADAIGATLVETEEGAMSPAQCAALQAENAELLRKLLKLHEKYAELNDRFLELQSRPH